MIGAFPPLTYVGIPSDLFKPVHLGTYHRICKPHIYWQAGSCPSTESLPVFMMFVSVCSDGCKTAGRSLTPYLANYFCIKISLIIASIPCKNYIEILKKKDLKTMSRSPLLTVNVPLFEGKLSKNRFLPVRIAPKELAKNYPTTIQKHMQKAINLMHLRKLHLTNGKYLWLN